MYLKLVLSGIFDTKCKILYFCLLNFFSNILYFDEIKRGNILKRQLISALNFFRGDLNFFNFANAYLGRRRLRGPRRARGGRG